MQQACKYSSTGESNGYERSRLSFPQCTKICIYVCTASTLKKSEDVIVT